MEDGVTRQPIRAKTLPPIETHLGRREKLVARSREKYAARRHVIENKLNRWLSTEPAVTGAQVDRLPRKR